MNLAYKFPLLFWNCANIIVDSMATDLINEDEDEIGYTEEESDEEEEEEKSSSPVAYGKIAKAIGRMKTYGVEIYLPEINKSRLTFSPSLDNNTIYYGLKGISKINDTIAENITLCRPYSSIWDLIDKVKLNKPQVVSLIKSGAFDEFGDRMEIMKQYISSISDTKTKLTLSNFQMLINYDLIPESLDYQRRVFNFNKYIKKEKLSEDYFLDQIAYNFYSSNYDISLLAHNTITDNGDVTALIKQKTWDKIYKKEMDIVRNYLKENMSELLDNLNWKLMQENWDKYAKGSLSKWEMDSVSFYQHEHELARVPRDVYAITNFFDLDEDPSVDYSFTTKDNIEIKIHKLYRIAGTVLDKDKAKRTVTLLTTDGVVTVKLHNSQFAKYDKQISIKLASGKKKVIEKSWFSRGNKILFTGIRKGNTFVPKVYKKSEWQEPIQLITDINEEGFMLLKSEREGENEYSIN